MKGIYWLFYLLFVLGFGVISCSGDNPIVDSEGNIGSNGDDESNGEENGSPDTGVKTLDYGELFAFPYAEGHGRNATGGRGGAVYVVTRLDDPAGKPEGTLRYAVEKSGARTVVFAISGTIMLERELKTKNNNLTIAGQTSPGGICIANYPFTINSDNVIIRFIRFRPGNINTDNDGLGGSDNKNIIIDHCSVSWGTDEGLSVYGSEYTTVQWCLVAQSLRATPAKITGEKFNTHGYGGNWGGHYASYHHNIIAHCESRVPRLGPRYTTLALDKGELVDIRNNVYYNYAGEGCYGGEAQKVNLVNNYYKPGPATKLFTGSKEKRQYRIAKPDVYPKDYSGADYKKWLQTWGRFYVSGNCVEGYSDVTADNWQDGVFGQMDAKNCEGGESAALWKEHTSIKVNSPVSGAGHVTTHSAVDAYDMVLQYAGACNYRDKLDELIISDVRKGVATCTGSAKEWESLKGWSDNKPGYINKPSDIGTNAGQLDEKGFPVLATDTEICTEDTDSDGIPDYWEKEYGLDFKKNDANERTVDVNGKYTNIEMYMNSLVHGIMEAGSKGGAVAD